MPQAAGDTFCLRLNGVLLYVYAALISLIYLQIADEYFGCFHIVRYGHNIAMKMEILASLWDLGFSTLGTTRDSKA